jgi:hypothetical protein
MKTLQPTKSKGGALALIGAISLLAVATGQAAFTALPSPTPEFPGVTLTATNGLTGTIIAFNDSSFSETGIPGPSFTGTLRSLVVQQPGGNLDFYYQVINTSTPALLVGLPAGTSQDIYRVKTTGGYVPTSITATTTFRQDGVTGLTLGSGVVIPGGLGSILAGTQAPATADRDEGTVGSLGFDFARFIGNPTDPLNVNAGETSNFLVVRTNASTFGLSPTVISGDGSARATAFTPIPEPGTVLFGLAVLGVCASRTYRRRGQTLEA